MRRLARQTFGFEQLRPGQEEAVRAAAAGRDVVAVLPTGAGRSAIFHLAALIIPGPTVVVSPLIALQRDQVAAVAGQRGRCRRRRLPGPGGRARAGLDTE